MPNVTSSLGTTQDYIPLVNATQLGKAAGLHMHFATLTALNSAVTAERANIDATSSIWPAGQPFSVATEPVGVRRSWLIGGSGAASHARTVHLRNGLSVVLAADSNTVLTTSGAPASGTGANGDIAVDYANNLYYTKSSGSWDAGVAIFPSSGGGSGGYTEEIVSGTSRTLGAADDMKTLIFTNAGAIAVSVPAAANGIRVQLVWGEGVGTITVTPSSTTINGAGTAIVLSQDPGSAELVPTPSVANSWTLAGAVGDLTPPAMKSWTMGLQAGEFPTGADDTIVIDEYATFPYRIDSSVSKCTSGTATYRLQINGTPVGTTANAVSSTQQTQAHSTANTVAVGQRLTLVRSANSSCVNGVLKVNCTRTG